MSEVKGRPLGNLGLSEENIAHFLCNILDSLLEGTMSSTSKNTMNQLVRGQGIFMWVSQDGIPLLKYSDHTEEFNSLSENQTLLPKEDLQDLVPMFKSIEQESLDTSCLAHNDLHIFNALRHEQDLGLIDFACSYRTFPLADYGGILAHVGLEQREHILSRARAFSEQNDLTHDNLEAMVDFFCLKRTLRRLAFLNYSLGDVKLFSSKNNSVWTKPSLILDFFITQFFEGQIQDVILHDKENCVDEIKGIESKMQQVFQENEECFKKVKHVIEKILKEESILESVTNNESLSNYLSEKYQISIRKVDATISWQLPTIERISSVEPCDSNYEESNAQRSSNNLNNVFR